MGALSKLFFYWWHFFRSQNTASISRISYHWIKRNLPFDFFIECGSASIDPMVHLQLPDNFVKLTKKAILKMFVAADIAAKCWARGVLAGADHLEQAATRPSSQVRAARRGPSHICQSSCLVPRPWISFDICFPPESAH